MMPLEKIEVLSSLPKVELAKLVGEVEEVHLAAGQSLPIDKHVFFVGSGLMELQYTDPSTQEVLTIQRLGPGEVLGEWSLLHECTDTPLVVATADSALYGISVDRWRMVTERYPDVNATFQLVVLKRLHESQRTVARYKQYVTTYANELWPGSERTHTTGNLVQAAAAAQAAELHDSTTAPPKEKDGAPAAPSEKPARKADPMRLPVTRWLLWTFSILCLAAALMVWAVPGLPSRDTVSISLILLWTAVNWYTGLISDYAVGLTACLVTVALGIMTSAEAFAGFADPAWFLLLGAFGLGAAIQRSGLLYRVALHMLKALPPTYTGQAIALALSGVVLTPCLPAVQSRVTISGMLSLEMSEAMRFKPGSKGSAGLAMSAFLGFGQMRYLFLNGSSYSLLAWGLLPLAIRQNAGWSQWFWAALPLGITAFSVTLWVTIGWMFPENRAVVSRTIIQRQLAILGEMAQWEKYTLWVTLMVVLGFLLQPLHHIDPSWVALGGMLILVMLDVLDKDAILVKIDWQYMLFYGTLTGLVAMINKSGISNLLINKATTYLSPLLNDPFSFLLAAGVVTIILRLAFQPAPAILLMALSFYPLSSTLGYNPLLVAVVVVASTTSWLIPQLLSSYTTFYSSTQGRCFAHGQVRPLSIAYAGILLVAIATSVPVWHLLGLLGSP